MAKKTYISEKDYVVLAGVLRTGDYGWETLESKRKVILTNPGVFKDWGVTRYARFLMGTGHCEWEYLIGAWMTEAVGKALDTGKECDITEIFNKDLLSTPIEKGKDYRRFTKRQVYEKFMEFCRIEEESEDVLKITAII